MKLSLGFSPCPNDTFMFDALINKKINSGDYDFNLLIKDVEELNNKAFNSELDITKISYHAYTFISKQYEILTSGSALGFKNGPLMISKRKIYPDELKNIKVAIPGKYTTACLLLKIAYPEITDLNEYLFSDIEDVVLSDECDAGLIIHENRFTYTQKGLRLITDLGDWWEKETKLPIPLGCIIIKRNLPQKIKTEINALLKESIIYANNHVKEVLPFVRQYAANMDENVMLKHIDLYVNDYSLELNSIGKKAINALFAKASEYRKIPPIPENIFCS